MMFKDKSKSPPQDVQEPGAPEKPTGPSMSGTFMGYYPQWKHRGIVSAALNKRLLKLDGDDGKDWTNVHYVTIRGGMAVQLPDGTQLPVGVPFPQHQPRILETIHMCGYEQAMAMAWTFAAYCAAHGAEIEVRAEEYHLDYSIKSKLYEGKKAA